MNIFNNIYNLLFYQNPISLEKQLRIIHDKNEILSIKNKLKPIPSVNNNFLTTSSLFLNDIKNKNYVLKPTVKSTNNIRCDFLVDMLNKIRLSIK